METRSLFKITVLFVLSQIWMSVTHARASTTSVPMVMCTSKGTVCPVKVQPVEEDFYKCYPDFPYVVNIVAIGNRSVRVGWRTKEDCGLKPSSNIPIEGFRIFLMAHNACRSDSYKTCGDCELGKEARYVEFHELWEGFDVEARILSVGTEWRNLRNCKSKKRRYTAALLDWASIVQQAPTDSNRVPTVFPEPPATEGNSGVLSISSHVDSSPSSSNINSSDFISLTSAVMDLNKRPSSTRYKTVPTLSTSAPSQPNTTSRAVLFNTTATASPQYSKSVDKVVESSSVSTTTQRRPIKSTGVHPTSAQVLDNTGKEPSISALLLALPIVLCISVFLLFFCKHRMSQFLRKNSAKTNVLHVHMNKPKPPMHCQEILGCSDPRDGGGVCEVTTTPLQETPREFSDDHHVTSFSQTSERVHIPLVYISYSRLGCELSENVRMFAHALCENGVDVVLDQHEENEVAVDHATWVERRMSMATSILLVLSESHTFVLDDGLEEMSYIHNQHFSLCRYETLIIRSCLLGNCCKEVIPVYFGLAPIRFRVPLCLRNRTMYFCSTPPSLQCEGFSKLLSRLHNF